MTAPLETIARELEASRLHQTFGIRPVAVSEGRVTLSMALSAETERLPDSNQFHGGAIATFADVCGDAAVIAVLGAGVPTINIRVDFLRPASGPTLRAEAFCRRVGRTVAIADIDIFDAEGRLVAVGRGTYSAKVG